MKDTWGQELNVGDQVCVVRRIGRYVTNYFGEIVGFTPSGHLARIQTIKGEEFKAGERIFKKP